MLHKFARICLLTGLATAVFTGCQSGLSVAPQNHEISSLTQRIGALEAGIQGSSSKIETVQSSIDSDYKQTIATLQQQRQQAADAVYAASQANQQNPQKNAYTETVTESLQIAAANLGGSDAQGMQNAQTALKLELTGTKASLAQAQAMYDAQLKTAADLQNQLGQEQQTRAASESKLTTLENQRNQMQTNLQTSEDARNQAQTTLAQKLEAENQRLANDQALKKKLVFYLSIAGVLTGVAAAVAFRFYPPIGLHLALASGAFFLAAYLVSLVQPWMVFLVVGLAIAAIVWAVVVRHHRLSAIADSALGAIQQLKIRAAHGDQVAQQAYAQIEADLKNHFGAVVGSLESEAKQRLEKIPWFAPSTVVPTPAPATPPNTPAAPGAGGNSTGAAISVVATTTPAPTSRAN